ncbi:MAG: hypothetical protein IT260_14160 [Saprospiraceae bacterium]|nr:hypothetical protein [Saprospiraceae bacterium]
MNTDFRYRCTRVVFALALALTAGAVRAQPGAWVVRPAQFQYNMTMIAQVRINGVPSPLLNNSVAAFLGDQIRAYATPLRYNDQVYFFLTLYATQYKGDSLGLRAFIGADGRVYETANKVAFKHHTTQGSLQAPVQLNFQLGAAPLIYSLPTATYAENTCAEVLDVQATDNLNSEGNGLAYTITGGADAGKFSLHPQTGLLSWFNFVPDVEHPGDTNADNRYAVQVQVTDAAGLFDVQDIVVQVVKTVNQPVLICPGNLTLQTADDGTGNCQSTSFGTAVPVSNLCSSYQLSYQLSGATTASGIGQVPVLQAFNKGSTTVTYTQSGINSGQCAFTVSVADNELPTVNCPANLTLECNSGANYYPPLIQAWAGTASASDNCGVTLTHSYSTALPALSCNLSSGLSVVFTATDAAGNSAKCTRTVLVDDTQLPYFSSVPANVTVQCNSIPAPGTPLAADQCDNAVFITYNGQTRTNGSCADTYTLTRKWTAVDDCGNTKSATQVITVRDTQLPNFTNIPANVTVQCNSVPAVASPTATDNCDASVTITYNGQTRVDGACPDTYTLTRLWTATDNCNNTRTVSQRITVRDTQAPTFTFTPAPVTVECNALPAVGNPVATDNCDASVSISYGGQTITAGSCTDNYTIRRSWLATDNCGNTKTTTQLITVRDTKKPVFTSIPAPVTLECSASLPAVATPVATDNCDASVAITFQGESTTNASCSGNYQLVRQWLATDNCGNWATITQVITLQDTQKPTFTFVPAPITIECSALFPATPGTATATDNCSAQVYVVFSGQTSAPGPCLQNYVVTRTWTASDDCGNTQTATQTITVVDTTKPVFSNAPANLTLTCNTSIPSPPVVLATDNCDTYVPVTYNGQSTTGSGCSYSISRTWTVADDCGNTRVHTQVITVVPSLWGPGEDLSGGAAAQERAPVPAGLPSALRLVPNPAQDEVWVRLALPDTDQDVQVSLFDAGGRLVQQQSVPSWASDTAFRLDLSGLAGGLYTVQVLSAGQRVAERLVVWR